MPSSAYFSLGSNLGDRAANLRRAISMLVGAGSALVVSSFYEAEPVDVLDQPWFLNCAASVETQKSPRDLLEFVLSIEAAMGRVRTLNKGPRIIDIDILLYGERSINEPGLKIPHPAMHERRFVLEPLAEIARDVVHPILGKTTFELLEALPPGQAVRRWSRVSTVEQESHHSQT